MSSRSASRIGQKAETQQRIADAALDLFSDKGFGAVSVEAIGSVACVGHGTVFWHFGSKKTLYVEASRLAGELVRLEYEDTMDQFRGPDGMIKLLLHMYTFLKRNLRVWKMCLSNTYEVSGPNADLQEAVSYVNREIGSVWRSWVNQAQEDQILDPSICPEHLSRIIYGTLSGLMVSTQLADIDPCLYFRAFDEIIQRGAYRAELQENSRIGVNDGKV